MKRARTAKQRAWDKSSAFRSIALAALKRARAKKANGPKCGARKKSDGSPCRNPALENGRCRFHGGRTPKGAGWHKPRFPAAEKFLKKELELERRKRRQEARVRSMTPEQRATHEQWTKTHRPGAAVARARARQDRDAGALIAKLLARDVPAPAVPPEEDIFA